MIEVDLDLGQTNWGPKEWEDFDSTVKAVGRMIKITNIFKNDEYKPDDDGKNLS